MKNYLIFSVVYYSSIFFSNLFAQYSSNTAGGEATGSGGTVSYSYGQIVYTSFGTTGSVGQGVQQPIEISEVAGNEKIKGINLSITTFPNPTSNFITIKIHDFNTKNLTFKLIDASGKVIEKGDIISNETIISLKNLPSATYNIMISKELELLKNYKIVKN
ncbi:MAG: T9SS type A sorting domain-containing protein [Flavobacteriia bacterium]|nr:T9SS type A sorting domain-containing protein [Flavobacteriia bacterium]